MANMVGKPRRGKKETKSDDLFISNTEKVVEEKDETAFNKQIEEERKQKDKLPIEHMIDRATERGLFKDDKIVADNKFKSFVQGIKLHDILHDCIQGTLNEYCEKYNEKNPIDNLGLKLHLRHQRNNVKAIAAVDLVLELRRGGEYKLILKKSIEFTHVNQLRDEGGWKYSLYSSMFTSIVTISLNHLLLLDDVNTGRIKPEVSK